MRRRVLITFIVVAVLGTGAAFRAWYLYRFPHWTESISLPDGRTIDVYERRDLIEGYGTRKTWLTFSLPEMGGEQTWSESLYPTMIGVENGKVYVIGRPRADRQFELYAYPRYAYVAFLWQRDHFERIPFMSVPETLRRRENVRWCMPGGSDSRKAVTAPADGWCHWPAPVSPSNPYFARPQDVDLNVRMREAEFWAHLTGNKPASD